MTVSQLIPRFSPSYPLSYLPTPLSKPQLLYSLPPPVVQADRSGAERRKTQIDQASKMASSVTTNFSSTILPKPLLKPKLSHAKLFKTVCCSASSSPNNTPSNEESATSSLKAFSAALALSSILLSSPAVPPAAADISGLTPCKESKAFAKREKQSLKRLEVSLKKYAPDSAPALAIQATIEKTKRRFENYGNAGLLCGTDGLPHLIVNGDQRHWGEFITPGILFLYIAGWIGWVGRSYLIAIRGEKKPAMKEIIIDVPLAIPLLWRGFIWPVAAYRELVNGDLVVPDKDVSVTG